MVGLSPAAIDAEFRQRGQTLFVDTDGEIKVWGLRSSRKDLTLLGKEEEMKRFLVARALRD
jgi:hypothetical protein